MYKRKSDSTAQWLKPAELSVWEAKKYLDI